jgi:hypothetical protein
MEGIFRAWGKILTGRRPNLSIEITRECPLRCPGCYAYGEEHLGGGQTLRTLTDRKGQALIDGILEVVDRLGPLHVSLVGGEPLVRYRELDVVLPRLAERGIYVQLVTSAVRPGARSPPHSRHLRAHPQAHQRPPDHRALHGDQAADAARRLCRAIRPDVVGEPERALDLDEPLHAASG